MKVLKLATVIDTAGMLHLDIPTELSAGKFDVVIVLNPIISETAKVNPYDFSDLSGQLSWQGEGYGMSGIAAAIWVGTQTRLFQKVGFVDSTSLIVLLSSSP
jgi:hypothetical protein